jgi:hypothetical protein
MTQDDRMETITDPAAIRASDEPDERGDFPCCTTPAPVGAAVTLDLDAIEADALAALNPSRCRCTVQSGSVYSSQCPRHDPRDPGYRAPWQMPPATALALVAEVRRLTADLEKYRRGARTLGETVEWQARAALDASGRHDVIEEDGDGDWGVVWETLAELRPRAEAAEAEVVTLRARLAAVEALADQWADRKRSDGMSGNAWIGLTLSGVAADLRAALATTGEGE